jgi:hypothetical protein
VRGVVTSPRLVSLIFLGRSVYHNDDDPQVLLVLQSLCVTFATTLWPLYLQDTFGWGSRGYAPLVFLSSVFSAAAITLAPVLGRALGQLRVLVITYILGAGAAAVTFSTSDTTLGVWTHSVSFILLLTVLALLEPVLKANASTSMPESVQGISFGVLTSITGIGVMVGSPLATYLYNLSEAAAIAKGGEGSSPGALPMWVAGGFLVCSAVLLLAGVVVGGVSSSSDKHTHPR